MNYKIYRYVLPEHLPFSLSAHPGYIIFPQQLTKNLPRKQDLVLGERRRSVYCARYVDGEYIEPIVKIDYAFKRDDDGLAYQKLRTISWMLEGDKWSREVQTDVIPLSPSQQLIEIKRRRYNLVTELKGLAKLFGLENRTLEIFEKYQLEVNSYIDAGSSKLRDACAQDNADWLDEINAVTGNKPRDVFIMYFSIGLSEQLV